MNLGDNIVFEITGVNSEGEGLARYGEEGFVVFVKGALPGERVMCRVVKLARKYAVALVTEVLSASPGRVTPPCPVYGRCGGCQLQHASYATQLAIKAKILDDALCRIGGFKLATPSVCQPSPREWGYRNKTTLPVRGTRDGGKTIIGYFETASHRITPFESCAVLEKSLEGLVREMIRLLSASGFKGYDEPKGRGDIRHIAARTNGTEQIAAIVAARKFNARERGRLKNTIQLLQKKVPALKGMSLNIKRDRSNFIWGDESSGLSGKRFVRIMQGDYLFDLDITSFFQINSEQAHRLFSRTREAVSSFAPERTLELYAGVGGLTAYLASVSGHVDAVEEWRPAARLLGSNMSLNGISNVTQHAESAEKFLESATCAHDVVVMDPPRTGLSLSVTENILRLRPQGIVYVSCDPATLARDLARLSADGAYLLAGAEAYDMFPQTAHVESVAILKRA